ncbi:MAG: bifunctional PIG-L family deacetylase/class I SAM-dependent methyltransferase [Leeuwenhoekiella sp.]
MRYTLANFDNAPLLNKEGLNRDVGRTLVVSPHPDDESLGCGGMISLLRKQGVEVFVVFITSGGASHPNSKAFPAAKLALLRESEALQACLKLGVREDHISFLRAPDSKLFEIDDSHKSHLIMALTDLLETGNIQSLVIPWRRDPHRDHRETYTLAIEATKDLNFKIEIIEYPIWLWENGKKEDWPEVDEVELFKLDVSEVLAVKKAAIQEHQSQLGKVIHDDPEGFVLQPQVLDMFQEPFEYLMFSAKKGLDTLGEDYFDELYKKNSDPWNFKTSEYEHQKYKRSAGLLKGEHFTDGLEIGCSIGMHTLELAPFCNRLTAVDISEKALESAKEICKSRNNIFFKKLDITTEFPAGAYDLITLCEVGYYFDKETLLAVFEKIKEHLNAGGKLLMMHWTSYVPDYPLTGAAVHRFFKDWNTGFFKLLAEEKHTSYEMLYWGLAE